MAAVMTGMAHQETWSLRAGTATLTGMALVFATCTRDAVRFHVWSYMHLPLYLGIAVAGVGIERIITTATDAPLPRSEAIILFGSAIAVVASMAVIGRSGRRVKNPAL